MGFPGLQWRAERGAPVRVADGIVVTPEVRSLVVGGRSGGFVWNRPSAAVVQYGQQAWRLPIRDLNQLAQLGLVALAVLLIVRRKG